MYPTSPVLKPLDLLVLGHVMNNARKSQGKVCERCQRLARCDLWCKDKRARQLLPSERRLQLDLIECSKIMNSVSKVDYQIWFELIGNSTHRHTSKAKTEKTSRETKNICSFWNFSRPRYAFSNLTLYEVRPSGQTAVPHT